MFKRWLSASLILLAVSLGGAGMTAHAASPDDASALATAPRGILLNPQTTPILTVDTTSKSSATVVPTTDPQASGAQTVRLTSRPNQFGSAWSPSNDFELTKDQTLSMWLYLGNQGTLAGSGMAFVLQNDPHGVAAMPKFSPDVVPETLGVWATDTNMYQGSNVALAKTAIQNSWALEFDTRYNGASGSAAAGKADAFDSGYGPVHLASNYPGAATTYVQRQLPGVLGGPLARYYYTMIHAGVIAQVNQPDFLSNGQWHHVTLTWQAKTQEMTYRFDDRNPQTNAPQLGVAQTVHLNLQKIDPNHTGRARWGFTATTGTNRFETNLVVLENAPGLTNANVTATLTDVTRHRVIETDDQVLSNDQVRLDYLLTYIDGRQPWSNIDGHLRLPTGIHFTDAQILYSNRTSEKLDVSRLTTHQVVTKIGQTLDERQQQATVQLTGTAQATSAAVSVPAATSTFAASTLVTTATTPAFTVNPQADLRLTLDQTSLDLASGQPATVTGRLNLAENGLSAADVTLRPVLNDRGLAPFHPQADGTFRLSLSAAQLQAGTNHLEVTATTTRGDRSNEAALTVKIAGELKFAAISANERFQASKLTGNRQVVARQGNWQLAVQDTRGSGERWTLLAQASPFVASNGTRLAGQPIYVTPYQVIPIAETPTPVFSHVTDDRVDDGLVDVAAGWTADTGVLLAVNGGSAAGEYHGQLTWTLTDAPA